MSEYTRQYAKAALILTALIWGGSFIIMKSVSAVFPIVFIMAIRYSAGTIALAMLFLPRLRLMQDKRYLIGSITTGTTQVVAYFFQTLGLAWDTTPGKSAFISSAYCIFVPFFAWQMLRRRPSGWQFAAAFICITGIGLLSLNENLSISPGDGVTLFGSIVTTANIIAITRAGEQGCDPILLTIGQLSVAGALSWIVTLALGDYPISPLPAVSWISLIALGVIASALCLVLQSFGQKHVPPSQASLILSLESVFGVVFSVLFYGEILTPRIVIGFILTFCGIIISETQLRFLLENKLLVKMRKESSKI